MRCPAVTASSAKRTDASCVPRPAAPAPAVAALLQLQRTAGNRAAGQLIQRYIQGNHAAILSGQTEFEAQTVDHANRRIDAPTGTTVGNPAPTVRVSDDGQMAVEDSDLTGRQPKVLYTTNAVVTASNQALLAVNSDYELYVDRVNAIRITLPTGTQHNLSRVLPRKRVFSGAARTASEAGLTMDAPPDCIMMAKAVMQHGDNDRQPTLQVANLPDRPYAESRVAQYMAKWVSGVRKRAGFTGWLKFWNWFSTANGEARKAFRRDVVMTQQTLDAMALAYNQIQLNHPQLAKQVAQNLGANKYAVPQIGEAYETWRIGVGAPPQTTKVGNNSDRQFWGQHIGAVAAVSGGDRVTLENYARAHELAGGGMGSGARPDYYFQMYGSRKRQTWHWAWTEGARAIGAPGVGQTYDEALTQVVRTG